MISISPSVIERLLSEVLYAKTLSSVVLPEPLGPMIAIISLGRAKPETPCSTCLYVAWFLHTTLAIGIPLLLTGGLSK